MILDYFQTRFLLRNLIFYQKERDFSAVNSHQFLEAYYENPPSNFLGLHTIWRWFTCKSKEDFLKEKYRLIRDCALDDPHYIHINNSFHNVNKESREESDIQLRPSGKSAGTIGGIIFINMSVFMGLVFTALGSLITIISPRIWNLLQMIVHHK